MNKQVVVDTNILIAYIDKRDKWNSQAEVLFDTIEANNTEVIYLDCVLNEAISAMARRSEEQKRSHQVTTLLDELMQQAPKSQITWISGEVERLYDELVNLVRQTQGVLNFHDALIAIACRELGFKVIVSFDKDFDQIAWLTRVETADALQRALATPIAD